MPTTITRYPIDVGFCIGLFTAARWFIASWLVGRLSAEF
jgi:hypothetical protein